MPLKKKELMNVKFLEFDHFTVFIKRGYSILKKYTLKY